MALSQLPASSPTAGPLSGRRVGLALDADAIYSPAPDLVGQGAEVIHYPCEEMLPLDNSRELDGALRALADGQYEFILFTTPDSVTSVFDRLAALEIDEKILLKTNIAAFGADTNLALRARLINWDNTKQASDISGFVAALDPQPGSYFLLPISVGRTPHWTDRTTSREATVNIVPAYHAHMRSDGEDLPGMLWAGSIDAMVFMSADNVQYFATRLRHDGATLAMLDDVTIACIDQHTAGTAANFGLTQTVIATEPTPEALALALVNYFADHPYR